MNNHRKCFLSTLALLINCNLVQAAELPQIVHLKDASKAELDQASPVVVVVDQQTHLTHVLQYRDETLVDVLCVPNATGKAATPTPNCRARIVMKELNPTWTPPASIDPQQRVVAPFSKTKKNPLGMANLRLNIDRGMIALHGTNEPKRIGQSVSHGCIRHLNKDILTIYKAVRIGTPVYIVGHSDDASITVTDFENQSTVAKKPDGSGV